MCRRVHRRSDCNGEYWLFGSEGGVRVGGRSRAGNVKRDWPSVLGRDTPKVGPNQTVVLTDVSQRLSCSFQSCRAVCRWNPG